MRSLYEGGFMDGNKMMEIKFHFVMDNFRIAKFSKIPTKQRDWNLKL
jgi:hypothetical protein